MKKMAFLILFFCSVGGYSQTLDTVEELEFKEQDCLDSGANMVGCSEEYYKQMETLMNTVYDTVRSNLLSSEEKGKLKKEQLLWLKKKDKRFIELYRETITKLGTADGEEFKMALNDAKAAFVAERIKELIKRV